MIGAVICGHWFVALVMLRIPLPKGAAATVLCLDASQVFQKIIGSVWGISWYIKNGRFPLAEKQVPNFRRIWQSSTYQIESKPCENKLDALIRNRLCQTHIGAAIVIQRLILRIRHQ